MKTDDFVGWILRSPFHSLLSNGMMLITVTGCRTGTKYTVPVGYYREGEDLWVITSRHRTWWRNLLGGAEVGLVLKGKPVNAHAEPVLDQESVEARLEEYLFYLPQAAYSMGIRVEGGMPDPGDLEHVAKDRLFVKFNLS